MSEFLRARTVYLSYLSHVFGGSSNSDLRLLTDRKGAALYRDLVSTWLIPSESPQVLVLDLAGVSFTPSALQELILPLAQRIRGGEHGTVRLVISTTNSDVRDFIRYMSQAHQLPLYLSHSPSSSDLREAIPVGALTNTERNTLETILALGGQVTASKLAAAEGIRPSAAANRLVNLDREGYLVRRQRGRREGDLYIELRSVTSIPIDLEEEFEVRESGTGVSGQP